MKFKAVSGLLLTLLLFGMLPFVINIQPVRSVGTIYIRAEGSIDPPTANITSADNVTYTFTDNNYDEIVVERDNIVFDGAGYVLQGSGWAGSGTGIYLSYRSNVTITNMRIERFGCGISLTGSSNNSITGNNIKANDDYGIYLGSSSNNNKITGNDIIGNEDGIYIDSSSYNIISGNNIRANYYFGILLTSSSNNIFFHNHIYNNLISQVWEVYGHANIWDDGYPSGGNYWSDYTGVDVKSGPNQDQPSSDGIGDTSYVIDENNQDNYPLMIPRNQHDIGIASVYPPKTVVGEGFNVTQIDVTVFNYGNNTENFNLTAYNTTSTIGTSTNITLTGENSTTTTFTWNTSNFAKGNYIINFYVTPAPNETYTEDNTYTYWVVVTISGDVDADRDVDVIDQRKVALAMFTIPGDYSWDPNMDVDRNLRVDVIDQRLQMIHMFETW